MTGWLDGLLNVPAPVAYALVAALVFGEAAVFVGFVLPGETAVVLGGVLAYRGDLSLPALLAVVVVAAIVGDSVGYEVGRRYGDWVLRIRPLRRHEPRLAAAQDFLRRRGASAVFLGRWTAFLRAMMPGLAGVSRMRYPRFVAFNAIGGLAWGTTFVLVGYLAGDSYARVEKIAGRSAAAATAAVVLILLVVWHRRRAARTAERPEYQQEDAA
jgi:membrane protein DedA with SNARE-associated domain